ncbi:MAG: DUF2231 domain-containing protein [Microthrixaceae bacterium]
MNGDADRSTELKLSDKELRQGERARAAAHRPGTAVSGPYGHPFHPLLVTIPIGAWVCTVALDIASKISEGRAYARPAVWLCAVGIVAAVVAAVFGLIDFRRLTKGTKAHQAALTHLVLMVTVLVLFVVSFILRRSGSESSSYLSDGTATGAMAVAIVGLVLLAVGGWFGGRLVYTYGVRVADEQDQLAGHVPMRVGVEEVKAEVPDSGSVSAGGAGASNARDESTS